MEEKISVITGASGHIGYALLIKLLEQGEKVRILIRRNEPRFDNLGCEKVFGDVNDKASLNKAFQGAHTVYHLAGVIDINNGDESIVWKVNVDGVKNVVAACEAQGVARLVYASSVDAFTPLPDNALMREVNHFEPDILDGTYAKTKATATNFVFEKCAAGFPAVVVYPGACLGPYDYKVSSVGEMVRMCLRGSMPASLAFGAYNFVDVRDVADGMIAAAKQGKLGEGYILCGEQISTDGFIKAVMHACGKKAPKFKMKKGLVSAAAPVMEIYYKATKKTPLFTRYSIRKLTSNCNFSIEKAKTELGYNPMPVKQSIADMVQWIKENEK
ncbi:MAG: NAD-dependent epimerase/dehydratase family protein [Ruminococcaceae bacterium]|nr:NAD-dependent epimerase/dehydratase family protein [Oscillospiraceae bacterium]